MNCSFNRKRLNENPLPPSIQPTKDQQRHHIMDDITHGQWSKNHYDDDNNKNSQSNDDISDPYRMQQTFRKIARKLSRNL
jgi:hypothetical protein